MKALIIAISLFCSIAQAKKLKVAIIDTGAPKEKLECYEAYNFTESKTVDDYNGHGSNIAALIAENAGKDTHCPIYMKYYDVVKPENNLKNTLNALRTAILIDVDVIVYAAGGEDSSKEETELIKKALDKKIVIIVSAGNNSRDLGKSCNYYPACSDPRVIVVGCKASNGEKCSFSNYGTRIDLWDQGENIKAGGYDKTGTSQSTAIIAGKFIKFLHKIGGIK